MVDESSRRQLKIKLLSCDELEKAKVVMKNDFRGRRREIFAVV